MRERTFVKKSYEMKDCNTYTFLNRIRYLYRFSQESRREGWTDAAIMLCKLNKSL